MDTVIDYPEFQPEQVLTRKDLEDLSEYLEDQSKTMRGIKGNLTFIIMMLILSLILQLLGCWRAFRLDRKR